MHSTTTGCRRVDLIDRASQCLIPPKPVCDQFFDSGRNGEISCSGQGQNYEPDSGFG